MEPNKSEMGAGGWFVAIYLRTLVWVLCISAIAKLLSVAGGVAVLRAPDPLVGLQLRWLMLVEAAVELAAARVLASQVDWRIRLLVVFWLGALFCSYHLFLSILDPSAYCPCLGTLYGRLGIRPATADALAKIVAALFFVGPLMIWVSRRYAANRNPNRLPGRHGASVSDVAIK